MTVITSVLNRLWSKRCEIAAVQAKIDAATADLLRERKALEVEEEALEKEAKAKAKFIPVDQRHTLVGDDLQMVYSESRSVDWNVLPEIVARYGITENDLARLVSTKEVWSIRKVGKR